MAKSGTNGSTKHGSRDESELIKEFAERRVEKAIVSGSTMFHKLPDANGEVKLVTTPAALDRAAADLISYIRGLPRQIRRGLLAQPCA